MREPPYNALDVANYIVSISENRYMCNMRLQFVLYFIQLMHLRFNRRIFFADEIEAWKSGPVIPKVYQTFSIHGSLQIPITADLANKAKGAIAEADKTFIKDAVDACEKFSTIELMAIVCKHAAWATSINKTITVDNLLKQAYNIS